MKTIHINTSKEYDVIIGKGLINKTVVLSKKVIDSNKIMIITDCHVEKLYAKNLAQDFANDGYDVYLFVFKAGEESKNISVYSDILENLAMKGFTRKDVIVAVGGGVVGDLAGFVAATYMRGIKLIQVPTTFLAMVDSSIGGKTAINLSSGKNLAGAFWQPDLVICDTDIICSLPRKILSEGLGEVVKYALIRNSKIIKYIKSNTVKQNIEKIIIECIQIKADIVSFDEFEKNGERKILNAGHTIAHAIETKSNHKIAHGEAVKIGLILEAELAWHQNMCSYETLCEVNDIVKATGLVKCNYSIDNLVDYMSVDKKNIDSDTIGFVLPMKVGEYKVVNICKKLI